jgi:integrase
MKKYRVTPKNGKFIIQRISDRKTVSAKPFLDDTEAEEAMQNMIAKEIISNTPGNSITFVKAFKDFAAWKLSLYKEDGRVDRHSLQRYDTEYRCRISKYMDQNVLLSDFGITHMEQYLDNCKEAGVPFKTMRKSVKDIKHFLRRANAVDLKPNLSMLTYKIYDHLGVIPEDDDLIYTKEVDINVLDDDKVSSILNTLYQGMKAKDHNATNTFAIMCMLFFFGLRASELSGIRKDAVDLDARLLHIQGTWRNHKWRNKTKNRGSKRSIEIDDDAMKFLEMWMYHRLEYKPDNIYLLAGKNNGPLSYQYIIDQLWKTYAAHGLAKIEYQKGGHVKVISSPLKNYPTKIFRHRFGSHLIAAMNKNPLLDRNRVKRLIGHTKFSTSSDVYGNKEIRGTDDERRAIAAAKGSANNSNIFSKIVNN